MSKRSIIVLMKHLHKLLDPICYDSVVSLSFGTIYSSYWRRRTETHKKKFNNFYSQTRTICMYEWYNIWRSDGNDYEY
jgi:hypothetical protein